MKRFLLAFICLVCVLPISAQDRIVLKNSDELKAKVINISPDVVTYQLWSNLDGPTYTTPKSNILFIVYKNGTKEVFKAESTTITTTTTTTTSSTTNISFRFQGYGNLGLVYCPDAAAAGPTVDLNVGVAINDFFYAGFATGFHSLITTYDSYYGNSYTYFDGYIPLAVNLKGYFTKTKVRPFVNVSLGGFIGVADFGGYNGFYCQVGAGVDINRFSIGLGYNGLVKVGTASCLYFNVGMRFGGKKY
jgi:hypothetical protein